MKQVDLLNLIQIRKEKLLRDLNFDEWLKKVSPHYDWDVPHLLYMQKYIQRIINGESLNVMFFSPPRHAKSTQNTIHLSAHFLEKFPQKNVILASYNQTLANKFSRKSRKIVESRIDLSSERTACEDWETKFDGGLRSVGIGGGITGQGGNLIILDDVVKNREEANSQTMREKIWDWFKDDLSTRLEPHGSMILTMTRWHYDDLAGRILASDFASDWECVKFPALAEENDVLGRKEGDALWPDRFPKEVLLKIKTILGADFESLYQQNPTAAEGDIIKREWWRYYKEPPKFNYILQSWDTAFKKGEYNDYSVCTTWGRSEIDSKIYLLNMWRQKVEFPELNKSAVALAEKFKPNIILIEDKASGQSLIQAMKKNNAYPVKAVKVDSDKTTRVTAVTPMIESGNVILPEKAPFLIDFLDECSGFPNSAHDDIVDTIPIALNYFRELNKSMHFSIIG